MAALPKILGPNGKPYRDENPDPRPRAKYDAAQTTDNNKRHWANADALSPRAANNAATRATLRNRSRYETDNNGYFSGVADTLADDMVGVGPALEALTDNDADNDAIEARFGEWADETGFADDLHTLKRSKTMDGEVLAIAVNNPRLEAVQLDLRLVEAEYLAAPAKLRGMLPLWKFIDGIELDDAGNPVRYYLLRHHPGDFGIYSGEFDTYPAAQIIHYYRRKRPGQYRGLPEFLASLPLGAQLRRWTLAALGTAEIAADFAAVVESTVPADETDDEVEPYTTAEIERGMLLHLPANTKMSQLRAEQPTASYADFKRELLKEIGRPGSVPFNLMAGDSSAYNYSSARLDHLLYRGALIVERERCRRLVLERVFAWWYAEARLIAGYLPAGLPDKLPHSWRWPGFSSIDPLKEALADTERLTNGTTTLSELQGEEGKDWRRQIEQRQREVELYKKLGLPLPKWAVDGSGAAVPPDKATPNDPTQPPNRQTNEDAAARRDLIARLLDAEPAAANGRHN